MPVLLPALVSLLGLWAVGCAPGLIGARDYQWFEGRHDDRSARVGSLKLAWRRRLTPVDGGRYRPSETASATLDPAADRVYVGLSTGHFRAFTGAGSPVYAYEAGSAVGAAATLDAARDEVFVPTEGGVLHALRASTGKLLWRAEVQGALSQPVVLADDAVYAVTDSDVVVAFERTGGEALWRYRRDTPEAFFVSQHAGLLLHGRRLLAAFTEGVVVSLDPADGSVEWERDTTLDLEAGPDGPPRFADVDTTPLLVEGVLYVASFAGGLYALELESGSVLHRDREMTGVTAIAEATSRVLILSSGDRGIVAYDRVARRPLWERAASRGGPTQATVADGLVLFGETGGGFVTLALSSGRELGRFEAGHGFSAAATVAAGRGYVLSNGGSLIAFSM